MYTSQGARRMTPDSMNFHSELPPEIPKVPDSTLPQTPAQMLRFKLVFNEIALRDVINTLENMHKTGNALLDSQIILTLHNASNTLNMVSRLKGDTTHETE